MTLKTFKMPDHAERVQYILMSPNGRPVKGRVELWIGPIRCVHEMIYNCMNGGTFPLSATLQFKKRSRACQRAIERLTRFPTRPPRRQQARVRRLIPTPATRRDSRPAEKPPGRRRRVLQRAWDR